MTSGQIIFKAEGGKQGQAGFTLIEALCVMTIIALVMGLTVPSLLHTPDGPKLEAAARQIAGALRLARAEAIGRNAETLTMIDTDTRLISPSDHPPIQIPAEIALHLVVAKQEQRSQAVAGIRFFPDGTSSGGDVVLSLHNRDARVSVNWLNSEAKLTLASGLADTSTTNFRP